MAYKIEQLSESDHPDRLLFWGPSGTGKTRAAATWPKPMLFLDCDNGMASIKDRAGISRVGIPVESVIGLKHGTETMSRPVGYVTLVDAISALHDQAKAGALPWATIVLDGLSSLGEACLVFIQALNKSSGIKATPAEIGDAAGLMKDCIIALRELPCSVIVTTNDTFKAEPDAPPAQTVSQAMSRQLFRLPEALGSKLPFSLGRLFDEVWLFETEVRLEVVNKKAVEQIRYFAYTRARGVSPAKSRLDLPGNTICPVTYGGYSRMKEQGHETLL